MSQATKPITQSREHKTPMEDVPVSDITGLYFREMGQVDLLTQDQEVELAHSWQSGRQAEQRLAKNGHKGREKERLRKAIRAGYAAREHLITANTRLVISIAKRYRGQGVPFPDLIQEGNMGLMRAVDKFDPDRGYKLSTYATWWIRQAVSRAVSDHGRTIRLPVHMGDAIRRLKRTMQQLSQENGKPPTLEQIAKAMELPPAKVQWMMDVAQRTLSLQTPVGQEKDSELGQLIEDEQSPSPSEEAEQALLRSQLEEMLSTLSPRQARILRMRFGLENGETYTLEEIGNKFGVTRERIRQIEQQALQRLRHPWRSRRLRDFLQ